MRSSTGKSLSAPDPSRHDEAGISAAPAQASDSRSDVRALARGATLSVLGMVVGGILSFVLVLVVTHGLGPAGTGVFFEVVAVFTILASTTALGADTGMVRAVSRYRALGRLHDVKATIRVGLVPVSLAGVLFGSLLLVFAPQLAGVIVGDGHASEATTYMRVLAPFLPLTAAAAVTVAATRGFGSVLPYVALEHFGKGLLRPALAITAIALGWGSAGIALGWVLPAALELPIALVIVGLLLRREVERADAGADTPAGAGLAKEFWRFAAPRGIAILFQVTLLWLDVLLVGALRGPREAGIYAAASRFALVGLFGIEAVRLAIAPQLSHLLSRGERARAQHIYQVGTWWLIAISWPAYLAMILFAPVLLRMFGAQFAEGQTALVILSSAMLGAIAMGNVSVVLLMGGKSWLNLANTLGALALNIGLNLLLIPRMGIAGAALAWAISIAFENVAALLQVRFGMHLHPFGRGYALVVVTALACFLPTALLARWLFGQSIAALLVFVASGGAAYVAALWSLRDKLELGELWAAVRRRKQPASARSMLEGER